MAFVKLDCGILNSTLWLDRDAREVFITALLMAFPDELTAPAPQLMVRSLKTTGWKVPPGWYGIVPAAGVGIVRRAGLDRTRGLAALERLGLPEPDSRTKEYGGRRLVRIDGGFVVLNFIKYRERDHTAADRSRRYRERLKDRPSRVAVTASRVAGRNVTQADAEVDAERGTTKSKALVALTRDDHPKGNGQVSRGEPVAAIITELQTIGTETTTRLSQDAFRAVMVKIAFAYWSKRLGHERSLLDPKRVRIIERRLVENGDNLSELLWAVDGALKDDWIMGRDPKSSKRYDGIETIFQDRAHVEKYAAAMPQYATREVHPMALKYAGAPRG